MKEQIMSLLVSGLVPLGYTALISATAAAFAFARTHTANIKNATLKSIVNLAEHLVEAVVTDIEAYERPQVLAIAATGKIAPTDALSLKQSAILRVRAMLGTEGIKTLQSAAGLAPELVSTYLGALVEKAHATLPAELPAMAVDVAVVPK